MTAGTELSAALAAEAEAYRRLLAGENAQSELIVARDAYLASHELTPSSSWGRLLGALKTAILAADGVEPIARRAVAEARPADTPAPAYVCALSAVALGDRPDVSVMLAAGDAFARTGQALEALAAGDASGYAAALAEILADFESRDLHLSGVPYADTVAVLERLADQRGLAVSPSSDILRA